MLANVVDLRSVAFHGPEPQRGIGHLIEGRRTRGQDAVLDAEVRLAVVGDAVAGPVPTVNSAVVHLEGEQLRRHALPHLSERIILHICGQQDAEARQVLAVDVEDTLLDPALAEAYASRALAHVLVRAAGVEGLLKQRDPVFVPQASPEDDGAVCGCRQNRPRQRLRDVVVLHEVGGRHLEVHLETRVSRLEQWTVVFDGQLVDALESDLVVGVELVVADRLHECSVARHGRQVAHVEVELPQRRQDARQ